MANFKFKSPKCGDVELSFNIEAYGKSGQAYWDVSLVADVAKPTANNFLGEPYIKVAGRHGVVGPATGEDVYELLTCYGITPGEAKRRIGSSRLQKWLEEGYEKALKAISSNSAHDSYYGHWAQAGQPYEPPPTSVGGFFCLLFCCLAWLYFHYA